uniref:hypothetical protein n=1 Tax=Rhodaphanes brevistipitata TaxID=446136 RepID=UPI001FCD401A|nr:hypothetical protein MW432_pgp151 [Rhodaphanes brevistipitata]UNJ18430.1 hypothetical protein [Rhodaphanes brevistipitata]
MTSLVWKSDFLVLNSNTNESATQFEYYKWNFLLIKQIFHRLKIRFYLIIVSVLDSQKNSKFLNNKFVLQFNNKILINSEYDYVYKITTSYLIESITNKD